MKREYKIFRNAMFVEIVLEAFSVFGHSAVLAEVSVVALVTTGILWLWFMATEGR